MGTSQPIMAKVGCVLLRSTLLVGWILAVSFTQVSADCCTQDDSDNESAFCTVYHMLSVSEQAEVRLYLGENCAGDAEEALNKMEKRKPNFIRFGRSGPNFLRFGKRGADPNFLRFGRSGGNPNFLRFGKNDRNFLRFGRNTPNFLRFGRSADPNFLRFGKPDPNFLRFGKGKPNFLRFGRSSDDLDQFDREYRKP